jgi:MFS family permease
MSVASAARAPGFLDRERIIAAADFNRWLVPPAALAIHLCIGMAYGFSVFWLPMSKAVGINKSVACAPHMSWLATMLASDCDWKISLLGWTFTLFFVFLGTSAALLGGWLERVGPRKAGVVAAICWCGGLVIGALGVHLHQVWIVWLGCGVIGGIGLGLGYISPVSTLIKWFPDRRGMATGMAIMGFGGGAMIGAPLADRLMKLYANDTSVGVTATFLTLAAIYFLFMMSGALGYRLPAAGWRPAGTAPPTGAAMAAADRYVTLQTAWRTPQFWLLWAVLCLNVTAGIGILGMASPLLQEVFAGRLIGVPVAFTALNTVQLAQIAAIAAGFTGLLSLFNIAGRFCWASLSDRIGRRMTYAIFFLLGFALYASIPWTAHLGNLALFVAFFCVILSMYGGGFATVPAYLADLFGTRMVGAIHGRLLTAWSTAGVLGPVLVNYIRDYQIDHGIARANVYSITMYLLAALLLVGFVCNSLIRPVDARLFAAAESAAEAERAAAQAAAAAAHGAHPVALHSWQLWAAWLAVGIPIAWGVWVTLQKAVVLFR